MLLSRNSAILGMMVFIPVIHSVEIQEWMRITKRVSGN